MSVLVSGATTLSITTLSITLNKTRQSALLLC
jgi:hypothetical protein